MKLETTSRGMPTRIRTDDTTQSVKATQVMQDDDGLPTVLWNSEKGRRARQLDVSSACPMHPMAVQTSCCVFSRGYA